MERVFDDEDFNAILDQRKKVKLVFYIVLGAYIALAIASLAYYTSLPYKDKMQALPKAVMFISTALFIVFLFLYMGIKYHRVNKYCKMMYYLSEGMKNVEENYFVGFELNDLQKDNVDAISCVFKPGAKRKKSGCAAKRTGRRKRVCRRSKRAITFVTWCRAISWWRTRF